MSFIRCEQCGRILFSLNDEGLIVGDNNLIREVHGVCECGHGFHYSLADCYLKRLLAHYNQAKVEA